MRFCYLSATFILFSVAAMLSLSGCQDSGKKSPTTACTDKKSMLKMLEGSWILQEYEDSIDAGVTPKLLEYMLSKRACLTYQHDTLYTAGFSTQQEFRLYETNSHESYSFSIDPVANNISIKVYDEKHQLKETDSADLIVTTTDTILSLRRDSLVVNYVKYEVGSCPGILTYNHLVNSKFIAGKYYLAGDTAKLHHIILTKCGNIEGAAYMSPALYGYSAYEVTLANFFISTDAITFSNPQYKVGTAYHWTVDRDSLIFSADNESGNEAPIVLLKSR